MKVRMLKKYKELLGGTEWTTFEAGKVYDVPDRVANNFLGVGACELEATAEKRAEMEAKAEAEVKAAAEAEAEAKAKALEEEDSAADEAVLTAEEERMDAGPPENKAETPPEDKSDMPAHLVRGKGRGKASGKKADK